MYTINIFINSVGPTKRTTFILLSLYQGAGARPQPIICHHVAVSPFVKKNICEARFSLHSAHNLELATEDNDR